MIRRRQPVTDAEIAAFVEGTADARLVARIEAAAARDPGLAARIEAQDGFGRWLAPAMAPVLDAAPHARLGAILAAAAAASAPRLAPGPEHRPAPQPAPQSAPRPAPRRAAPRWYAAAPGLAAAFAAGIAFHQLAATPPGPAEAPQAPAWVEAVAGYVRLFTAATLGDEEPEAAARAGMLAAVGAEAGIDLAPAADADPALAFRRAEILALAGRPLAQLAFLHRETGRPVALCIIARGEPAPGAAAPEAGFREAEAEGLGAVHWDRPGFGFLVIGDLPAEELRRIAETIAGRLG